MSVIEDGKSSRAMQFQRVWTVVRILMDQLPTRWRNSRSMETKPNQSPIFMHRTQKPKDLFKKNFFFLFFLPCRIELNLSGNVRLERKITVYDLKNA